MNRSTYKNQSHIEIFLKENNIYQKIKVLTKARKNTYF